MLDDKKSNDLDTDKLLYPIAKETLVDGKSLTSSCRISSKDELTECHHGMPRQDLNLMLLSLSLDKFIFVLKHECICK